MARQLKLVTYGSRILRKKAEPVKEVTAEIRSLGEQMLEVMHQEGGVGLAAPQIGISKRILVLDGTSVDRAIKPMVLINPVLSKPEGKEFGKEGCLSLPGVEVEVKRALKIHVKALGPDGEKVEFDAKRFFARIIQHETDHLNGILLLDYLNPMEKVLALWRLRRPRWRKSSEFSRKREKKAMSTMVG